MPFKKVKGGYSSPSGRFMTKAQVKGYYASKGKKRKGKRGRSKR